jgi:hypothetical protein
VSALRCRPDTITGRYSAAHQTRPYRKGLHLEWGAFSRIDILDRSQTKLPRHGRQIVFAVQGCHSGFPRDAKGTGFARHASCHHLDRSIQARHTASLDANGMREILLAEKRRALSSRDEVLQTPRCLAILRSPRHPHGERRARRFSGIGWVQAPSGTEDSFIEPDCPTVS